VCKRKLVETCRSKHHPWFVTLSAVLQYTSCVDIIGNLDFSNWQDSSLALVFPNLKTINGQILFLVRATLQRLTPPFCLTSHVALRVRSYVKILLESRCSRRSHVWPFCASVVCVVQGLPPGISEIPRGAFPLLNSVAGGITISVRFVSCFSSCRSLGVSFYAVCCSIAFWSWLCDAHVRRVVFLAVVHAQFVAWFPPITRLDRLTFVVCARPRRATRS
jgi:hypothetical protein